MKGNQNIQHTVINTKTVFKTKWSKTKRKRIELASQGKKKSECYLSVVKKMSAGN